MRNSFQHIMALLHVKRQHGQNRDEGDNALRNAAANNHCLLAWALGCLEYSRVEMVVAISTMLHDNKKQIRKGRNRKQEHG